MEAVDRGLERGERGSEHEFGRWCEGIVPRVGFAGERRGFYGVEVIEVRRRSRRCRFVEASCGGESVCGDRG